jgi:hypothetical protein
MWAWAATAVFAPSVTSLGAAEQCLGADGNGGEKVSLAPFERAAVQLSVLFGETAADPRAPVTWRVYSTLDRYPGAERWDTEPLQSGVVTPNADNLGMATIRVEGVPYFKVCVTGDDSAPTYIVDAEYRRSVQRPDARGRSQAGSRVDWPGRST